jgi:hypothetical protein
MSVMLRIVMSVLQLKLDFIFLIVLLICRHLLIDLSAITVPSEKKCELPLNLLRFRDESSVRKRGKAYRVF